MWANKMLPPDNTALCQAVVRAFRPLMLLRLTLRGLEFDSLGLCVCGGGVLQFSDLPFSGSSLIV